MKGHRGKLTGIETEAFSPNHHHYRRWRAGERKFAKQVFARRQRHQGRAAVRAMLVEAAAWLDSFDREARRQWGAG
jgi:hypothetical protein